jgi:hypothetical protein
MEDRRNDLFRQIQFWLSVGCLTFSFMTFLLLVDVWRKVAELWSMIR